MKTWSICIICLALMVSCKHQAAERTEHEHMIASGESARDGVFIHITESYSDPHRVLMPFKMAVTMSDDRDVILYLDIHAVELVKKDAADLTMEGFDPLSKYIQVLLSRGVKIYACPTCMSIAGMKPEDLKEGIQTANKDAFFSFTEGKILSLDY